jgi:hypothetical protein
MHKPDQVRETRGSQLSRDLAAATARQPEFRLIATQLAKHEKTVAQVWDDAIALMSDQERDTARLVRKMLDNHGQSGVLGIPPDLLEKAREIAREMAVERLLSEINGVMDCDAFAPSGSGNRFARWALLRTEKQKKDELTAVAKCARELAEAMRRCAGTDQFGAELLGINHNDGSELPRRLEKLAQQAESRRVYPFLSKPNRDGSRASLWMRMLDRSLPRRLGKGRRSAVITTLVEVMLDLEPGSLEPAALRNSTKKKPNKIKPLSLSRARSRR